MWNRVYYKTAPGSLLIRGLHRHHTSATLTQHIIPLSISNTLSGGAVPSISLPLPLVINGVSQACAFSACLWLSFPRLYQTGKRRDSVSEGLHEEKRSKLPQNRRHTLIGGLQITHHARYAPT